MKSGSFSVDYYLYLYFYMLNIIIFSNEYNAQNLIQQYFVTPNVQALYTVNLEGFLE